MKRVVLTKKEKTESSITIRELLDKGTNLWLGIDFPRTPDKSIIVYRKNQYEVLTSNFRVVDVSIGNNGTCTKAFIKDLLRQDQIILSFKSRKKLLKWWLK